MRFKKSSVGWDRCGQNTECNSVTISAWNTRLGFGLALFLNAVNSYCIFNKFSFCCCIKSSNYFSKSDWLRLKLSREAGLALVSASKSNSANIFSNISVSTSSTLLVHLTSFTNYLFYCFTNYCSSQTVTLLSLSREFLS